MPGPITEYGRRFLQCAIASRDFPGAKAGVPDCQSGASVVLRHRVTRTFAGTAGGSWSCLVLPTPGVSSWTTNTLPSNTTAYGANPFPDYVSLFGNNTASGQTANVNGFRYVGMTVEIKPVSATLNSAGLITCARVPTIRSTPNPNPTETDFISGVWGLTQEGLTAMPAFYCGHINQGVYGWSVNNQSTWPFADVDLGIEPTPVRAAENSAQDVLVVGPASQFLGMGNMTPIVICITGTNANTAWALTVEHVVEYRAVPNSILAESASTPPPCDAVALDYYNTAARSMQAFVPADQNDGFWQRFLAAIGAGATAAAPFLGNWGMAAGGLGALATGMSTLML